MDLVRNENKHKFVQHVNYKTEKRQEIVGTLLIFAQSGSLEASTHGKFEASNNILSFTVSLIYKIAFPNKLKIKFIL